jgi:serine-type D-Ala-D-Ala carboxypeptidase
MGAGSLAETAENQDVVTDDGWREALRGEIDKYLSDEIDIGSFPGAVYAVGDENGILLEGALGHSVVKPAKMPTAVDTIYDVASLTKPLVTATLVLRACVDGRISLGDPVSKILPELDAEGKESLTYVDLLSHRGGFQAWYPLYAEGEGDAAYLQAINRRPLRYQPGTREIYSCLGYILLHQAIERAYSRSVEELAEENLFAPLGLRCSMFNPPPEMKYRIAATEYGNANEREMVALRNLQFRQFRKYMIWGEVNDGNAWYMGGVSGNAGLFSTARDVYELTRVYLVPREDIVPAEVVRTAMRNFTVGLEENRGLGWQLQTTKPSHPSSVMSENCFGHTGFTGTSTWCDPDRKLIAVLLTNRLHPFVKPLSMQSIRRRFHEIVVEAWDRRKADPR